MQQKPSEKLTDAGAAKAGPGDHWDTAVPSFGLRVLKSGVRTWVVGIRRPGAAHGRYRIGDPATLKCKDARAAAKAALDNPKAFFAARDHAEAVGEQTFRAKAEEFLAHARTKRGRELRDATVREYRRALLDHAKALHAMPVTEITRADVVSVIRKVAREHPVSAMRTRAALSRFWSWLVAGNSKPPVLFNVVTGTEGYETPKRARVLTDAEIKTLWAATADPTDFHLIVRLCLWLGCRRGEAGGMRRSELREGVWTVPGTRTKNHRQLVLPLPRQAQAALAALPELVGRDLLFGRGANGFQGWSKSKERLDRKLGFAEWDLHDLRRSVQTRMRGLGIERDHVNRVLNHAMGPIDDAYDHHGYVDEKRHALQRWADALDRIIGPEHGNVFPLDERRQAS